MISLFNISAWYARLNLALAGRVRRDRWTEGGSEQGRERGRELQHSSKGGCANRMRCVLTYVLGSGRGLEGVAESGRRLYYRLPRIEAHCAA